VNAAPDTGVGDPYEVLRQDPTMAGLVDRHGELPVEPAPDAFERLVVSVINQQLSTESAAAIRDRVFDRFEITPAALRDPDRSALRKAGLSSRKIDYLAAIAAAFQERDLSPGALQGCSNDNVVDRLTEIEGIGPWTSRMYLIFALGREDVFPVTDLGIRTAMQNLYGLEDPDAMVDHATAWAPYRSYASRYLWRSVD